jgi:hypothetical protein
VQLGTGAVKVAHDGGHAGLVAHHGGEVDGLLGVILGEAVRIVVSASLLKRRRRENFRPLFVAIEYPGLCRRTTSPFRGGGCSASWEGRPANRGGAPRTSCATSLLWVSRELKDVVKS